MKQFILSTIFIVFAFSASAFGSLTSIGYSAIPPSTIEPTEIKITIYPNPASDFIQISNHEDVSQIIVFNLVGRKMKTFEVQGDEKYNISNLPKGMYLVQLVNHGKKIITTQRISKR